MAVPRRETVDPEQEQFFHLYAHTVRRTYLCGFDSYSGLDYSHRRGWILNRLQDLMDAYSFQLIGYSLMSTHYHLVMRSLPENAAAWTPTEVVQRWNHIHPFNKDVFRKPLPLKSEQLEKLVTNEKKVKTYRERLTNLSWVMKDLNEYIARIANREDNCQGHFWASRFNSKILLSDCALISELVYVELNPIRACLADRPEDSEYTSVQARIQARAAAANLAELQQQAAELPATAVDALDELSQQAAVQGYLIDKAAWLCPIGNASAADGVLPQLTLDDYIELVDFTGRELRADKRGAIPSHLAPILERLEIRRHGWLLAAGDTTELFKLAKGKLTDLEALAAKRGKQRICGHCIAKQCFRD